MLRLSVPGASVLKVSVLKVVILAAWIRGAGLLVSGRSRSCLP